MGVKPSRSRLFAFAMKIDDAERLLSAVEMRDESLSEFVRRAIFRELDRLGFIGRSEREALSKVIDR